MKFYRSSFEPFKCPICGSPYFGWVFENWQCVGKYCKGWPSEFGVDPVPVTSSNYKPAHGGYPTAKDNRRFEIDIPCEWG